MLNRVMLIGRLGHDAELKYTKNGTPVLNAQIATSERFKDKDDKLQTVTTWHSLRGIGKRWEGIKNYFLKGTLLFVEGHLKYESYEDKNGTRRHVVYILISDFRFLGGGKAQQEQKETPASEYVPNTDKNHDIFTSDELPF